MSMLLHSQHLHERALTALLWTATFAVPIIFAAPGVSETGTALSASEHPSTCLAACSFGAFNHGSRQGLAHQCIAFSGPQSRARTRCSCQPAPTLPATSPSPSCKNTLESNVLGHRTTWCCAPRPWVSLGARTLGSHSGTTPNWEVGAGPLASIEKGRLD